MFECRYNCHTVAAEALLGALGTGVSTEVSQAHIVQRRSLCFQNAM